jgi:leader peptidase (prepilin peptidase)/N-methyltransferase
MVLLLIVPLALGWLSGWLVNYLSDTLPINRNLTHPACQACLVEFKWTYYLLFRDCKNCSKRRTNRTLVVQTIMSVVPLLIWVFPDHPLPFLLAFTLLLYFVVIMVIDLEHRLILHSLSIVGAFLGVGIGIYLRGRQSLMEGITTTFLGGAAGFVVMLVFYLFGELFVRYMAKKRGLATDEVALGFGDVTLSGILGLMLGWRAIFACLFFAILAGGLVSLIIIFKMLIAGKYKPFTAIPYAPFLIISAGYFLLL